MKFTQSYTLTFDAIVIIAFKCEFSVFCKTFVYTLELVAYENGCTTISLV